MEDQEEVEVLEDIEILMHQKHQEVLLQQKVHLK
jgi:hypothetical protein